MTAITTRITVSPDGAISTATPLPAGEHTATIAIGDTPLRRPGKPFTMTDYPVHDGPWDDSISLRREDMYGEMVADPAFVDTNALVYSSQKQSAFHVQVMAALERARQEGQELWISRQILREYLATVTRPQRGTPPLPIADALGDIDRFERDYNVAEDGPEVFSELCLLLARVPVGGKQVHDTNIVATMLAHGITRLLTFNEADSGASAA